MSGTRARCLQTLIPNEDAYDLAMNIFTFETGHSLPITETHVMEHGLYFLQGKGVYFLDDRGWRWRPRTSSGWGRSARRATTPRGPSASKYIYYKNVNREIPL